MQTRTKVITVTLLVAITAFVLAPQSPLGAQLWPEPKHDAVATGLQVPLFMALSVMEAVAFGLAVSFFVWGRPMTERLADGASGLATPLHLAVTWLFGNFWIHDNVHFINGMDLWGLLVIDYVFHVTLMASGIFVAWAFVRLGGERAARAEPPVV